MRPFVCGWVSEWVLPSVRHTLPCGHDTDYNFDHFQTSHVRFSWSEEESYWFWVMGSKAKVNFCTLCIKPCWHDTDGSSVQSFSNFTCKLWMVTGGTLLILDHRVKKVKVNFGILCIKPCGQNMDYSFCPITFKLHMKVVDDEGRDRFYFWSLGQGQCLLWHSVYKNLVGTIQTAVLVQSLSNFTCKLWMVRGGTLLIWVAG